MPKILRAESVRLVAAAATMFLAMCVVAGAICGHYDKQDYVIGPILIFSSGFWLWAAMASTDASAFYYLRGTALTRDRMLNAVAATFAGGAALAQISAHLFK
jgi:hypothetical protein